MRRTTPKEEARRLLDSLPDDVSYEDIQYHLSVQHKIAKGLNAAKEGDFIPDDDIEQRIARWARESGG